MLQLDRFEEDLSKALKFSNALVTAVIQVKEPDKQNQTEIKDGREWRQS
jgi:hypothetical protein